MGYGGAKTEDVALRGAIMVGTFAVAGLLVYGAVQDIKSDARQLSQEKVFKLLGESEMKDCVKEVDANISGLHRFLKGPLVEETGLKVVPMRVHVPLHNVPEEVLTEHCGAAQDRKKGDSTAKLVLVLDRWNYGDGAHYTGESVSFVELMHNWGIRDPKDIYGIADQYEQGFYYSDRWEFSGRTGKFGKDGQMYGISLMEFNMVLGSVKSSEEGARPRVVFLFYDTKSDSEGRLSVNSWLLVDEDMRVIKTNLRDPESLKIESKGVKKTVRLERHRGSRADRYSKARGPQVVPA